MALLSVSEAAERLGVLPRRIQQRIADGSLPAEKVGRGWAIDERHLARLAHDRFPGRPLSQRSAWSLLALAAGEHDHLSPVERSRARARLRELLDAADARADEPALAARLSRLLRERAQRRLYRASPRDLSDVRNDARLRLSGVSAEEAGIAAADVVEGYVSVKHVDVFVDDYLLSDAGDDRANVILHVYDPRLVPKGHVSWSPLLLAADLAEHDGPREHGQMFEALRVLLAHARNEKEAGRAR